MNELMNELKNQGLTAELTNTGGGVMVAFIELMNGKTIGVDEGSICLYDSDMFEEEVIFTLDSSLEYGNALKTIAQGARLAVEKMGN